MDVRRTPNVFTVQEAKDIVAAKERCQFCDALHAVRRRSLNSMMAKQLAALYRYFRHPQVYDNLQFHRIDKFGHWLHTPRYLLYTRLHPECAKLRYWGFIDQHPEDKDDGNPHNGYVRITDKGRAFCERKIKTYRYLLEKNQGGGLVGFVDGEFVDIVEAGKNKFDYDKEIRGEGA